MLGFGIRLTKKLAVDLVLFHFIRSFRDGVTFFECECSLDVFAGDHKPSFLFLLIILNLVVVEIEFYNPAHAPQDLAS